MAVDYIKRALPSALGVTWWQGCKAAAEQSRGWSGGSTEDRGPEDGCVDRGTQRQRLACCMQNGILVTDLPPGIKVGYNPFTPKSVLSIFFGHIETIANLPGAETHWQDSHI